MAKKILIVDDEADMINVTAFRLKRSGYDVLTAVNGQEGLDMIKDKAPDLVLLDLRIPIISGFDLCKMVKADDKTKHIPIIFFTASSGLHVEEKVKEAGANDYLIKPFDSEELLNKIKKYI